MSEEQNTSNVVSLEQRKEAAKLFTKADLLADVDKVEEEYFELIDAKIPMRRLQSAEWESLQELMSSGVTLHGKQGEQGEQDLDMSIDVQQSVAGEALARRKAVAMVMSVNGETYTPAEVGRIPNPGLVSAIAARAFKKAGVNAEQMEAVKRAREDAAGGESSVSGDEGDAAGE